MGSKLIVFIGLFLCMSLLMISSQVAGTNVAEALNTVETSSKGAEKTDGVAVGDAKYPDGGYGGYPGGGYPGRGGPGGGRGGYCRYGCCGRSYYRGGCRCCTYAGEKPNAEPQAKPQN